MSLNVTAADLAAGSYAETLLASVAASGFPADRLTLEVTEQALLADIQLAANTLATLAGHGIRVALDDFGAGYTSFRSLRLLGVDMVKIDGSFIQNLGIQAEDELFVRTLIDLATSFGIITVGEWVGDEKTARLLENAGVAYMQGYFFGAPELAKTAVRSDAGGIG